MLSRSATYCYKGKPYAYISRPIASQNRHDENPA